MRDVVTGAGQPAKAKAQVLVHVRGFLSRGENFLDTHHDGNPIRIELGKRECIAGLRYGIVGMQVGGQRELIVSPHLGYGSEGVSGKIPPDALLRFEVELLEVGPAGLLKAETGEPIRHLYFFWPGEMKCDRPRVQFGLQQDGRCGLAFTPAPAPGLTWRHTSTRSLEHHLDPVETAALLNEAESLPQKHAAACLTNESLWADSSEKSNSITRDLITNTPCVSIGISDRGVWLCYFSLRQDDPVLLQTKVFGLVVRLIERSRDQEWK